VLTLRASAPVDMAIRIRRPDWATEGMSIEVNGQPLPVRSFPGAYATIERLWHDGDTIRITMPMSLRTEPMPDDPTMVAFFYGPTLLCAEQSDTPVSAPPPAVVARPGEILRALEPLPQELRFTARGVTRSIDPDTIGAAGDLVLRPHFSVSGERYSVYLPTRTEAEWDAQARQIVEQARIRRELDERTTDLIRMGEMQPERDHSVRGENTRAGEHWGKKWRDAFDGGWFAFDMRVDPEKPMGLLCQYWGGDGWGRDFDILINGKVIATKSLRAAKPGEFFTELYPIPEELTHGEAEVEVRFDAHDGQVAGGLFGECRMLIRPE